MSAAKKKTSKSKSAPADKKGAKDRFVESLIVRGEAVPDETGKPLPPGATHVIVKGKKGGDKPEVKRVRFALR